MKSLPDVTRNLATFACADREAPTAVARISADRAIVDTVMVGLAARRTEQTELLLSWARGQRGDGRATSWIDGGLTSAAHAAFENAFAAHALDYDDVSPMTRLHPSVVLTPALLARAEEEGLAGDSVLTAYGVGAAAFRAVAEALPALEHYERGWHSTATVGVVAATCALAYLMGLSEEATARALGLCGSMASGSVRNFGTMAKPYQVARAASDAVVATDLARLGVTANPHQLDLPDGYFGMYGSFNAERLRHLPEELDRWASQWPEDLSVKRYPSCYATHRALDALQDLIDDGLDVTDIASIQVVTEPSGLAPLLTTTPRNGLEAKFSLPYVLTTLLTHSEISLGAFEDTAVRDCDPANMDRVVATEAELPPIGSPHHESGFTVVTVRARNGVEVSARRDHTRGHATEPLSDDEFQHKKEDCLVAAGLNGTAALSGFGDFASSDVRKVLAPLQDALRSECQDREASAL